MTTIKERYTELLIEKIQPTGNTLQVGFGSGKAATEIQSYHPKNHVIIEADSTLALKANQWGKEQKNVQVIELRWQETLSQLGVFDAIFYNDYPIDCQIKQAIPKPLTGAQNLLKEIEKAMFKIKTLFTDEEIDEFYRSVGEQHKNELSTFFNTLRSQGNITEEQYHKVTAKYHIECLAKNAFSEGNNPLTFLEECFNTHMHKGSRFSSFLLNSMSQYEDQAFFDLIITNPFVDYSEEVITINPTDQKPIQVLVNLTIKTG